MIDIVCLLFVPPAQANIKTNMVSNNLHHVIRYAIRNARAIVSEVNVSFNQNKVRTRPEVLCRVLV